MTPAEITARLAARKRAMQSGARTWDELARCIVENPSTLRAQVRRGSLTPDVEARIAAYFARVEAVEPDVEVNDPLPW